MARPKEFDRDAALAGALEVFWAKGYEGASTDDLLRAMKIGRQSMYDTFGDKHALFLESLRSYHKLDHKNFFDHLGDNPSPLKVLHGFLSIFSRRSAEENARGCMGINATTAFGRTEPEVAELARNTAAGVEAMLVELVSAAQEAGELAETLDAGPAAGFLYAALQGLTVRAQAGAGRAELADVANFTIEALKAMR
ncbi:TetR family transcriptional regulator [Youhaiella tibetensis]|uniref:TetR/AcrR family transcriptional regulator n=1 Tax=Paradevosia tibetensis TaxID=1447062 RepID=A0A5B9DRT6_9HYPH|nr:TetR/AcrR family transcriptional regulator [Youhaiella tibetensis]QEE21863.1 TetR/AcrR family transcriptional regulator [Youhaiella tibetensis]GGF47651.1 TetR family transcriptional regulator [Youhaiella tibetensis]